MAQPDLPVFERRLAQVTAPGPLCAATASSLAMNLLNSHYSLEDCRRSCLSHCCCCRRVKVAASTACFQRHVHHLHLLVVPKTHGVNRSKISATPCFSAGETQATQTPHGATSMPELHLVAHVCCSPQSARTVHL